MDTGELRCVTSELTVLEVTVLPLRAGEGALADRYESLLTTSRGLTLIPIDREQLYLAARLSARCAGLRTPDAIQLAAALGAGATAFVTNDRALPRVGGLEIVQLGEVNR
jgi:predicted nucleic acid-binding protein